MKSLILWSTLVVTLAGYLLWSSLVPVAETETVVVTHFGKPIRTIDQAGLAFKLPAPVQTRLSVDKRLQHLVVPPLEVVTRDRRNLVVSAFATWRVVDAERFIGTLRDITSAELRLADLLMAGLAAEFGQRSNVEIFGDAGQGVRLDELFDRVNTQANQAAIPEFGVEIVLTRPSQISFPSQNLRAIYQRMSAEQERLARQYRAEGQEAAARIQAETERETRELIAQAEKEAKLIEAKAEAQAAEVYSQAYGENPEYYAFLRSLDAYRAFLGDNALLTLSADHPVFRYLLTPPEISTAP